MFFTVNGVLKSWEIENRSVNLELLEDSMYYYFVITLYP